MRRFFILTVGFVLLATFAPYVPSEAQQADDATPLAANYPNGNQEVLVDPVRPLIYWADPGGNRVNYTNASTGLLDSYVLVGLHPVSMDLSTNGTYLFVSLAGENRIATVDVDARAVARSIDLGFAPGSLRVGRPDRLYVANGGDIVVLNATSGAVVANVAGSSFAAVLETSPDGSLLLATMLGSSPLKIDKYSIVDDVLVWLGGDHHDLGSNFQQEAVDWVKGVIYLASGSPYAIEMVSLETLDRIGALPMEIYPVGVALSPDGRTVFGITSVGTESALWAFNTTSGAPEGRIPFTSERWLAAVSEDGANLFVGLPVQRVTSPPSVSPWSPAPDLVFCYSPDRIRASVTLGLPDALLDGFGLLLDGLAMPSVYEDVVTTYETYHLLSADVGSIMANGTHRVDAEILWNAQTFTTTWNFTFDRDAGAPACPAVGQGTPWGILDTPPTFVDAPVWHGSPEANIEAAGLFLESEPLAIADWSGDRIRAELNRTLPDGVYNVTAHIAWRGGGSTATWNFTVDTDYSVPRVPLVPFTSAYGFRLSVPAGWTLRENVTSPANPGNPIELIVLGESLDGIQRTLLVDVGINSTVRESEEYLAGQLQESVAAIQADSPGAVLNGTPVYRTLANHSAVTFVIQYASQPRTQKFALVVSEAHGRFWILSLSSHSQSWPMMNATFERILTSFVITLEVPSPPSDGNVLPTTPDNLGLIVAIAATGAGAGVAVLSFVLLARRRRQRSPRKPGELPPI